MVKTDIFFEVYTPDTKNFSLVIDELCYKITHLNLDRYCNFIFNVSNLFTEKNMSLTYITRIKKLLKICVYLIQEKQLSFITLQCTKLSEIPELLDILNFIKISGVLKNFNICIKYPTSELDNIYYNTEFKQLKEKYLDLNVGFYLNINESIITFFQSDFSVILYPACFEVKRLDFIKKLSQFIKQNISVESLKRNKKYEWCNIQDNTLYHLCKSNYISYIDSDISPFYDIEKLNRV